jgi:tRNA A37 threonylcarbamoyladenosine synthetase subunit TsaC/SUA5/YrdC
MTEPASRLAEAFWAGDLSMRLQWRDPSNGILSVGIPTGLVGIPGGLLGAMAAALGMPLVSTSVNFSGLPSEGGTQPAFAFEQVVEMLAANPLAAAVSAVVNGGICPQVEATSVVDCGVAGCTVLERPGAVHLDALRYVVPDLDISRARRDSAGYHQHSKSATSTGQCP